MGWQDRDYAKEPSRGGPFASVRRTGWPRPRSIVTTLIIANVAVYVLAMVNRTLFHWIYNYGVMQAEAVVQGQVWRLFTAQYLHDPSGIWHLAINMLVLHFLGRPLERLWSAGKFFFIYTLCGLAGNVFFTILGALEWIDPQMPAVGASGCIYGLLGIVAVMFPHATVYIYFLFPMRIRTAALVFGGIAFLSVLGRGANYGGEACHLAGLVFGVGWAWKGEAWWSALRGRLSNRSGWTRRRKSEGFQAKVEERREDAETIDRILRKVYEGGIHALSEVEKRALREATERQKDRGEEAGWVDRR